MLQNPCKTLGFKKNMVYKIPPGRGGKPYPASGLILAFPVTFKDLMEPVFNQALKAGHVGFVTDTCIQCISSSL